MNNTQVSTIGVSAAPREQAGARSVAIAMYCILLLSYVLDGGGPLSLPGHRPVRAA